MWLIVIPAGIAVLIFAWLLPDVSRDFILVMLSVQSALTMERIIKVVSIRRAALIDGAWEKDTQQPEAQKQHRQNAWIGLQIVLAFVAFWGLLVAAFILAELTRDKTI